MPPKKRQIEAESEGEQQQTKKPKAGGKQAKSSLTHGTDAEGNPYWEISNNRRVGISEFKGSTLINIREYYTAAGELRPGKKGISLSLDQYKAFLNLIPDLNAALQSQGHSVGSLPPGETAGASVPSDKPAKAKRQKKANIDATSDEDEGGGESDDR